MKQATAEKVIKKMSWEIIKQERFLGYVQRAMGMKPKDRDIILANALWIDGTIDTQINYARGRREKLMKARERIAKKYGIAF